MDLYQIFITHNRPWSIREILLFFVIFTAAAGFFYRRYKQGRIVMSQVVSGLLLLCFLAIVYGSTVFTRTPSLERTYEMKLFWSWKEVFRGNREMLERDSAEYDSVVSCRPAASVCSRKKAFLEKGTGFWTFCFGGD